MTDGKPLQLAVLLACYNRHQITLPNLERLIEGLDGSAVSFQIYLLDDASPDETGRRVREQFPAVTVVEGTGNLFWNRGMHAVFTEAVKHGPFDAYLLFNDDVTVEQGAVQKFVALYRKLNEETPSTLVGATRAKGSERITYTGYRLASRHRPLSLIALQPGGEPVRCDTFNANFVMIPARTIEEIGGFDPYYWHQFGDIDLGLSIVARGERILLAPTTIGRCDNGRSVPSRHGLAARLRQGLTGRGDPRQRAHFILKHSPTRIGGLVAVSAMLVRRLWTLITNKPHVAGGSDAARPGS